MNIIQTGNIFKTNNVPIESLKKIQIGAMSFEDQCEYIYKYSLNQSPGYVCVANVHMMVEALNDKKFLNILNKSTFIVPDGMPLVWLLRKKNKNIERISGYDLFMDICYRSEKDKTPIMFFGSTEEVLSKIKKNIQKRFPHINIVGMIAPPFGDISKLETKKIDDLITECNPKIIFVALGCPKQEIWMYNNHKKFKSLMIGVGGAFPLIAGTQSRAPSVIRNMGFEWLFRLILEPRRLWKRYIQTNTRFIVELIMSFFKKIRKK